MDVSLQNTNRRSPRTVILLLAASVGLMMTGYGIVAPVFARRLAELGSGVETLGFMTMAFAIAQFLLAPFMGSFADRVGRRPLILIALAGVVIANLGYLVAQSTGAYIVVRFFQGAVTAGLLPAAMAIVADTVPAEQRAKWVGMLMGSYGAGFIFGPAIGGFLFDQWGFVAPFGVSAGLALIGLVLAFILVPETQSITSHARPDPFTAPRASWITSLPRPLYLLATLLALDFVTVFVFAFVEPQMIFYLYDQLGISTTQLGLIIGTYGLALVFGQTVLARLSDRFGRQPLIVAGLVLNSVFYVGLGATHQVGLLFVVAIMAGLGSSLIAPALSALYLDITAEQHRSRVLGLKESMAALGGVAGPLLVAVVSRWTSPQGVFAIATVLIAVAAIMALIVLKRSTTRSTRSPLAPVEMTAAPVAVTVK